MKDRAGRDLLKHQEEGERPRVFNWFSFDEKEQEQEQEQE